MIKETFFFLYNSILYEPILNALVVLYNSVAFQDLGIAIILLTILVRILLFPLFHKSMSHQIKMQQLQPKLKKIQDDHKHDKEKQATALMEFYKTHKVNPFSGLLLLFAQLPVLFTLFYVFRGGLGQAIYSKLYWFVHVPATNNYFFLNIIDLTKPNTYLLIIGVFAQYIQGRLTLTKNSDKMARRMLLLPPVLLGVFFWKISAAIWVYMITTTLFSIVQQKIIMKSLQKTDAQLPINTKTT